MPAICTGVSKYLVHGKMQHDPGRPGAKGPGPRPSVLSDFSIKASGDARPWDFLRIKPGPPLAQPIFVTSQRKIIIRICFEISVARGSGPEVRGPRARGPGPGARPGGFGLPGARAGRPEVQRGPRGPEAPPGSHQKMEKHELKNNMNSKIPPLMPDPMVAK